MKNLLIAFLLLCFIAANAQDFNYQRTWSTYFGGENTKILDNAIDSNGNIYIVGYIQGDGTYLHSFMTSGSFQEVFGGGMNDGYIAKFDKDGLLIWSTFYGGQGDDSVNSIVIDAQDRIFIAGETTSDNLSTQGSYSETLAGLKDAFLAEFSTVGQRIGCTYYGGIYNDKFSGIDCDNQGNLYLFGLTSSQSGISTPLSFQEVFVANSTIVSPEVDYKDFMVKFTDNGIRLWGTYFGTNTGNSSTSTTTGISINSTGVYLVGFVFDGVSNTYFATPGCHQATNSNAAGIGVDMFLTKFSFQGNRLWSTYYGGSSSDKTIGPSSTNVTVTNFRNVKATDNFIYISGVTFSANNIVTPGAFQTVKQNYSNFLAMFSDTGVRQWGSYLGNGPTSLPGSTDYAQYSMLNLDADGEIFISGSTNVFDVASTGSYQPAISSNDPNLAIHSDSFVAKISKDGSSRYFGTYYGGLETESGTNTLIDDNDFYIIGTTQSTSNISTVNSHQAALSSDAVTDAQLDENGFIAKFSQLPLASTGFTDYTRVIHPVPNNGNFVVKLNVNYINSELAVFDAAGRKVHSENIVEVEQAVHIPGLSKGVYIILINKGNDLRYKTKIIIER